MKSKQSLAAYVRNFIFGVEDSLVSTVGLLSGISIAGMSKTEIVLTGVILIFVEAFSMGVGSFLSETSAEEFMQENKISKKQTISRGLVMFLSYFIAGFIPLAPYLFLDTKEAFIWSVVVSLISLFFLGFTSGKIFKAKILKSSFRMLVVGGIAIAIGILVGSFVK